MLAELPDISRLAHHRGSQPLVFDGVCGIRGVLLEIDRDLVDLHRLEASDGISKPSSMRSSVSSGSSMERRFRSQPRALLGLTQPFEDDNRHDR